MASTQLLLLLLLLLLSSQLLILLLVLLGGPPYLTCEALTALPMWHHHAVLQRMITLGLSTRADLLLAQLPDLSLMLDPNL